ncbi:hypothetical protein IGI37_001016 [Enterococcus sp. AZ194]|uniref:hypothetical protein n=1 Tax=Enterococcus sp. AZ194 TaxID=2774629 RepID=UPI003F1F02A7
MKIIGLGGLSESGKSYSGRYLSEKYFVPKVKIVKYIEGFRSRYFQDELNLEDFHRYLYDKPSDFTDFFLDKMINLLYEEYGHYPFIVIESLHDPFLGEYFKRKLKNDFIIIYLEATLENRIARESIKTGKNVSEVRNLTYEKDILKVSHGALEYKKISDYTIENDKTQEVLNQELSKIIELEIEQIKQK